MERTRLAVTHHDAPGAPGGPRAERADGPIRLAVLTSIALQWVAYPKRLEYSARPGRYRLHTPSEGRVRAGAVEATPRARQTTRFNTERDIAVGHTI